MSERRGSRSRLRRDAPARLPISDYRDIVELAHGGGGKTAAAHRGLFAPAFATRTSSRSTTARARRPAARDSPSPPTRSWCARSSSPAATSARSPSTARSTTSPCAAPTAGALLRLHPRGGAGDGDARPRRRLDARRRDAAGVAIVTGDTKVVDRGKGDGVYVNTAGIGLVPDGVEIDPPRPPGDVVLLSGRIAEHGIAILSVREGLEFESPIRSDSAALHELVATLLAALGGDVHVLRDPTRGGVASATNEIAAKARVGIRLDEPAIPLAGRCGAPARSSASTRSTSPTRASCSRSSLREAAESALAIVRAHPLGGEAAIVGEVVAERPGLVTLRSSIGGERIVDLLTGEQLPRIC
jgi:hydrogenase expression/formation protein HypE